MKYHLINVYQNWPPKGREERGMFHHSRFRFGRQSLFRLTSHFSCRTAYSGSEKKLSGLVAGDRDESAGDILLFPCLMG
jgi:hypothetical protein